MYKKNLIISDNLEMATFFFDFVKSDEQYSVFDFDLSVSPYSNVKLFKEKIEKNVLSYNLKIENDVNDIIHNYDLVISIHSKQIFPSKLVNSLKCINVHPGYNPLNRGWYPQVFAIINQIPVGATIHEIDEELDHGFIIDRVFVEKNSYDTSLTLYNKILQEEKNLIIKNLKSILTNSYKVVIPENIGSLYLKKDFNELCMLDLNEVGTFKSFYDKLRALTHGDYKNAFFIDEESGKKVYVSIDTKVES